MKFNHLAAAPPSESGRGASRCTAKTPLGRAAADPPCPVAALRRPRLPAFRPRQPETRRADAPRQLRGVRRWARLARPRLCRQTDVARDRAVRATAAQRRGRGGTTILMQCDIETRTRSRPVRRVRRIYAHTNLRTRASRVRTRLRHHLSPTFTLPPPGTVETLDPRGAPRCDRGAGGVEPAEPAVGGGLRLGGRLSGRPGPPIPGSRPVASRAFFGAFGV